MRRRGCLCFSHGKVHTKPSISYWCESSRTSSAAVWMFIVYCCKTNGDYLRKPSGVSWKKFPQQWWFSFWHLLILRQRVISWGWFAGLPAWRKKVIWFAVSLIALFVGLISLGNLPTLLIINLPTKHCQHPKLSASNVLHLISLWSCYTVILLYFYILLY